VLQSLGQGISLLLRPLRDLNAQLRPQVDGSASGISLRPKLALELSDASSFSLLALPSPRADLNTATAADLHDIPGIGEAKALEIIAYRERVGLYRNIEELKMISGIGAKTISAIGERFEVHPPR
jgi:competence ComEA-like helix-hairpin-helix protein